jgi:hypothetical protein
VLPDFRNKNPNLGKFGKGLQWKMLVFLGPFSLPNLRPNGTILVILQFSGKLVYFAPFWYIVSRKLWQP